MRANLDTIDLRRADELERRFRHDVMAHVHHFGEVAPAARGVIHLGATSAFVTDNSELLQHRDALQLVRRAAAGLHARAGRLLRASIATCPRSATRTSSRRSPPRSASAPRSGCRTSCWTSRRSIYRLDTLRFRGVRGTTGTEASFLELFDGDHGKVEELNRRVARKMGFERLYGVTGQTYPRKSDYALSGQPGRHRRVGVEICASTCGCCST